MSHDLNSFKRGYIQDYIGDYYRVIKGDTRSLDYGSSSAARPEQSLGPVFGSLMDIFWTGVVWVFLKMAAPGA